MSIKTLALSAALSFVTLPVFAEIVISDAYARSASPNAKSGAAFMQIMNTGDTDDRLIDVRTDVAKRSELHTHIMEDGVAHMIHVEEGFALPAGGMTMLERGGKHVMMMGLNGPFVDGESITVTFVFEQAGEMDVDIIIDLERMPEMEMEMDHGNMESDSDY